MPSVSKRQQAFMGAELARKRAGKATKTHMTEDQLRDYARKVEPRHVAAAAKHMRRRIARRN